MASHHIQALLFSLFLLPSLLLSAPISAKNISFDSASFSFSNLTLLGDSYLRNGAIGLTRETDVPSSSSGTVVCNLPVQFYDPSTNTSASFSTKFSFSITNPNPQSQGDGLTFFISPSNETLGSTGGYLGLFNATAPAKNGSIIGFEFDTRLDEEFGDPNDNHVGLDINSPNSSKAVDAGSYGIELKSGNTTTAWIDYYDGDNQLEIRLSYSAVKPEKPVLSLRVDLSEHFEETMYVGFSASTEGSTELHTIKDWSFRTFGLPSLNPSSINPSPDGRGNTSSIIPAMPATSPRSSFRRKLGFALGIMGPVALCIAFVLFVWVSIKKYMEYKANKQGLATEFLKGPRKFSYREMSTSTRGFHTSRIIGNGAFGTVYKAIIPGSRIAFAVKRSKQAHQSKKEFISELSIIACLRHKNLVQLEGWCDEKGELLLVYEFMPNGSLDKLLYREPNSCGSSPTILQWPDRYNVAVGIASVLSYLHQECEQQVIHRDVKTSNILLDSNFNPRLGDFGLARLTDHNKSPVSTLTAGTMGYLAPEYLQYGKATEKTDVFSYGVVVLEICCGRRPIFDRENERAKKMVNLVDWVWGLYSEDRLIEAADARLNIGEFEREEMERLLLVGLSCANPNCAERPTMRRVLQVLNREAEPVAVPRKKPLLVFASSTSFSMREIVADCEQSMKSQEIGC
ncbi:probable L-type lectin-domain containing receptor kinase S.7 [Ananas comosus]|uniref:non-specific serine/threonine protein kinase n=1 Tax=Ananas comosus TaxID=4615 RepID=A0A6P5F3C2_ANACO|nr:probable L-type lectin-domain containing receptor kinase S.7 [Ananas comosus]